MHCKLVPCTEHWYQALNIGTKHWTLVPCNKHWYHATNIGTMHWTQLPCVEHRYHALHTFAMYCTLVQCIAQSYNALNISTMHFTLVVVLLFSTVQLFLFLLLKNSTPTRCLPNPVSLLICFCYLKHVGFSKHWPSGPMLSLSQNVPMSVCLFVCSLLRYRLTVFLPPLPKVGCLIFWIWNPWGKVMERSGLRFEIFSLEVV